jgi:8-oxo-dGTP diphosphatase
LIDRNKVNLLQKTPKTLDADWFDIAAIPDLAFDHKEIVDMAIRVLRKQIMETNLVSQLMPEKFTLPELRSVYELLLGRELERRNFRKKFLTMGLIEPVGETTHEGRMRPAEVYRFVTKDFREVEVF